MKNTKLLLGGSFVALTMLLASFSMPAQAAVPPYWNVSGNYVVNMEYLGTQYPHDLSLTQDASGNLTGSGGSPSGSNVYTWVLTSGSVSGNDIDFLANYTATADAVTPQTVLHVTGTVASDGTISGTWSDNYQGESRSGALSTVSGAAVQITHALTVTLAGAGSGSVSSNGAGINCGADCTESFANNTAVTLTASAGVGSTFAGWSGDCTGTGSCALTMSAAKSVTATFTLNPTPVTHTISAVAGANGSMSPSGSVVVNNGNNQTFTITANSGYHIDSVLVDGSSVGAVSAYTFSNVIADHTISASFAQDTAGGGETPSDKNACKNGGWKNFTNPSFKNQGQCVSWTNHH